MVIIVLIVFIGVILGLSYLLNKLVARFIPEGRNQKLLTTLSFLAIAIILGVSVWLLIINNLRFER